MPSVIFLYFGLIPLFRTNRCFLLPDSDDLRLIFCVIIFTKFTAVWSGYNCTNVTDRRTEGWHAFQSF